MSTAALEALAGARARALRALMPGTKGRRRQDLEAGAAALELLAEGVGRLDRAGQGLADAFNEEAEGLAVLLCPHCRAGSEHPPASRGASNDGAPTWWHGALECRASIALELRERVLERMTTQAQAARAARAGQN